MKYLFNAFFVFLTDILAFTVSSWKAKQRVFISKLNFMLLEVMQNRVRVIELNINYVHI